MNLPEHKKASRTPQRRLGECLLAEGLINTHQLEEAIEYQCIYGGKLGTSLIELGLIEEDQMARILSQQLHLHYIKPELLMNVPGSVLNLIPDKVALKHQMVPYHEEGKKLYVAINDVVNLKRLDDISFQLNHIIIPLAIPEIRLMMALKKHYGMLLSPRYETLAVQMSRRNLAAAKKAPAKQPATTQDSTVKVNKGSEQVSFDDEAAWPLLGDAELSPADHIEDTYVAEHTPPEESSVDILHLLAEANERDDIATALISYFKTDFPQCALFMVRGDTVSGWLAAGDKTRQDFDHLTVPLAENSVFSLVATSRTHYLGPVISSNQNRKILDFFATPLPQNTLTVPLMVKDRLVSILYIQGRLEKLEQHFADIQYIVGKAEMAFKLLILKNKILSS